MKQRAQIRGMMQERASPFKRLTTSATRRLAVHRSIGSTNSDAIFTSSVHAGPCRRGGLNFKGSRIHGPHDHLGTRGLDTVILAMERMGTGKVTDDGLQMGVTVH